MENKQFLLIKKYKLNLIIIILLFFNFKYAFN